MTSQRRDPRIDQFCDQLLAQLRDSPSPPTTPEVAAGIRVRRIELWPVRGGPTARVGDTARGRCIISCEGNRPAGNVVYLVAEPAPVHTIYRDVAALAARGMIQRLNGIPGSRTVRWTYLPKDDIVAPSDVDAVEALLSNPAAPSRRNTRQTKGPVNSQMSISSAPIVTAKPARPSVLSSIRRHIAAIVLVMIFAAGLGLVVSLSVRPLDPGHVDRGPSAPAGVWTR